MFDYETLKIIWWLLIGVLLIGFAIMDGHDMGVGTLLPFVGRSDIERRVIINTIGPHWDGNQVWFITGGGALFAAWPSVYATAFSGFYWAMLAVLWALFLRPVGFDFRSKIDHPTWRKTWDYGLFIGGTVPPLIFGIAFGNLLQGVPFHFDHMMTSYYTGTFAELLNPFALLCGIVSSAMVTLHGSVYLAHRTEGQIQQRAKQAALIFGIILLAGFTLAGLWVTSGISGYKIVSIGDINTALAPMAKTVNKEAGAWLINYGKMPLTILFPISVYVFAISALVLLRFGHTLLAFSASALVCAGVILTVATAMFPFIMPSSTVPQASLTVWDSVSTRNTLTIMLWATLLLMPIIVIYTSWAYKVMAGKVTEAYVRENDHRLY